MTVAAQRAAQQLLAARSWLADGVALDAADTAVIGVDLEALDGQLDVLRSAFPPSVRHAIAIKTMPHPDMLRHLVQHGFGLEAASLEEVQLALEVGADPTDVIFDSPVKTRAEIEWCQEHLVGGLLNANSIAELDRYPASPRFQVGLRVNPDIDTGAPSRFDVSGRRSKFGVSITTDRSRLVDACHRSGVTALHMHIGSQVPNTDAHTDAVGRLLELAESMEQITTIDIGGGIRAETDAAIHADPRPGQPHGLMEHYGARLQSDHPGLFDFDVRTEFGQWVHTHAGWAASRVESVEQRSVPMAFVHLGADYFMRDIYTGEGTMPYGIAVVRPDGSVALADTEHAAGQTYDIVGPLCFAGDVLARDLPLPRVSEGDWLVFAGTGANTFGLWSRHCSRTVPKVVATSPAGVHMWSQRQRP